MPPKSKARKDRKASGEAAKQQAAEEEKQQQQDEKSSSRADDESEAEDADGFEDAEGGDEEAAATSKVAEDVKSAAEQGQPSNTPAEAEVKETDKPDVEEQPEFRQVEPGNVSANGSDAAQTNETQGEAAGQPSVEVESTPAQSSEEAAAPAISEEAATQVAQAAQPPPPPPRPAPIDTKKAEDTNAPASAPEDAPRKRSQSSLWDRLRSPAEKAAQQQAESSTSPGPTTLSPTASSSGQASPSEQRRPSYRALSSSSILNSLTSAANYAATSAASRGFAIPERLGGAAAMPSLSPNERRSNTRLPRHQVDEAQLMEDQMRFAEARHTLSTSSDREVLRQLGKDLESAYRSKLAEVTSLRVDLEDVSSSVEDIQDENGHLREQMAQLSEEIARREEDLEGFQRLTVAHQERERELWRQEGVEERERLEWKEREAVRGLAEERAINAQLRLALFAQIRDGASSGRGGGSGSGAGSRLSVLPGPSPGGAIFESSSDAGDDSPDLRQQQRLSRGEGGSSGGEESTRIQEDILFNLSQAHTANGGSDREGGGDGASTPTRSSLSSNAAAAARHSSLLSDVVPLDQLRLLLSLDEDDNERDIGGGGGGGEGANGTSDSLLAPPPSHLTRSASPGQTPTTMSTLSPHLQTAKRVADYQLSQALQLENLSLRSQLRDAAKRYDEKDAEVATLREKVAGMEEAIAGLLEGGGA